MSAFIVSKATMNRVVKAIDKNSHGTWAGLVTSTSRDLDNVGRELYAMNKAAMRERYGKDDEEANRKITYRYGGAASAATNLEFYMAVGCLLYQCSEGKVPETSLFKALDALHDHLGHKIAGDLCRARNIPWDFPERV